MDELEDAKETPEEMASNFTCAMFETPQAVLKGARHMVCNLLVFSCSVIKSILLKLVMLHIYSGGCNLTIYCGLF